LHRARDFSDDRTGVGIPIGQTLTTLDCITIINTQTRTILHAVRCTLSAISTNNSDRNVATHRDQIAIGIFRNILVTQFDLAIEIALDEGRIGNRRRTANVEGTHGQLRAWLTNRLCGNNANRFTNIDRCTASKVTTIARTAHAIRRFASENRTDLHFLNACSIDRFDMMLFDHRAFCDDDLALLIGEIFCRCTTQDTRCQ